MRRATKLGSIVALLTAACNAPTPTTRPSSEVSVPHAGTSSAPPPPKRPRAPPPPRALLVDDGGVGDVRLGQAIPKAYLADEGQAKRRYEIRWVADAQPFEAFRVGDPPLLATFHGPFTRWAKSNVGELEPSRFVVEALKVARAGAPVESILVEARGPATSAGIGVGSSFAELSSAYPGATLLRLPEWFDSRPTCRVDVSEPPHVSFHLAACRGSERGDVIRIFVER
jgi:hypothetical protein